MGIQSKTILVMLCLSTACGSCIDCEPILGRHYYCTTTFLTEIEVNKNLRTTDATNLQNLEMSFCTYQYKEYPAPTLFPFETKDVNLISELPIQDSIAGMHLEVGTYSQDHTESTRSIGLCIYKESLNQSKPGPHLFNCDERLPCPVNEMDDAPIFFCPSEIILLWGREGRIYLNEWQSGRISYQTTQFFETDATNAVYVSRFTISETPISDSNNFVRVIDK